jgi:taurine dioxygenase
MSTVAVRPLREKFGHEILDFDIARADEAQLRELDELYRWNSLLVLRNQQLTPEQLTAFAGRFGTIVPQTAKEQALPGLPGYPGICYVSNRDAEGRPFARIKEGRWWHTDGTTLEKPGLTTILYGIETPAEGGDTLYADASAAFNSLPAEKQAELEAVRVVHSLKYLMERAAVHRPDGLTPEERDMPDVIHPIVLTNPLDGRKSFYLTAGSARSVIGMPDEEGRQFIKAWIAYATQEQFVYRHRWQPGDVVIWNDVCTLHSATDYDETKYDRLLYRCWMTPVAA